jgi:hypothetical protein
MEKIRYLQSKKHYLLLILIDYKFLKANCYNSLLFLCVMKNLLHMELNHQNIFTLSTVEGS